MNLSISDYEAGVRGTDRLSPSELKPVLLGLYGEVGSIMSTAKKLHREKEAYSAYLADVIDEFGDALWYLTALCRRKGFKLAEIIEEVSSQQDITSNIILGINSSAPVARVHTFQKPGEMDDLLLALGIITASLLELNMDKQSWHDKIVEFVCIYLKAVQVSQIPFMEIVEGNLKKVRGRFIAPEKASLRDFDKGFPIEERLPEKFQIEITERSKGRSYLRWHDVFIGDPLTDNIKDEDGYRFHDVFHFANAAILHWSPTFRALIRHKRKSDPIVDENQDSGRAIVIEEGLSAYIFSYAKQLDYFNEQNSISLDLLKTIKNFVRGYEVEQCSLYLWEDAILQGYKVFREVKMNNGGIVVGDRKNRKIWYEALK